jgi:hypothetical protein
MCLSWTPRLRASVAMAGYSISALSRHFGVSRFVVRRELAEMGLSVKVADSGSATPRKAGVPASL